MENQVKITLIEIENSKRIKAFKAHPAENGLTVIGGRNGQGKTSVLSSQIISYNAIVASLENLHVSPINCIVNSNEHSQGLGICL